VSVETFPLPPRVLPWGERREAFAVRVDGRFVGTIERDAGGDWRWRRSGMVGSQPTRCGLRMEALDELVRVAALPRLPRRGIPAERRIVRAGAGEGGDVDPFAGRTEISAEDRENGQRRSQGQRQ
jgi:hypothetical protein